MLRGLYTAAGGLITQQRRHDVITNNIANLTTPGYKAQDAVIRSFPEMLIQLVNGGDGEQVRNIGHINTGVMVEEILPIFVQGTLRETGRASDTALIASLRVTEMAGDEEVEILFDESGKGYNQAGEVVYQPQAFYTVWNEAGELRYTRNGQLMVDANGGLRTTDGYRVIGRDEQPIILDRPLEEIRIAPDGALLDAQGAPLPNEPYIAISRIDNPYALVREGNGVYRLEDPEGGEPDFVLNPEEFSIQQGFVEGSNVDPAQSMVDMMAALRAYEANQKVIQFYDRSLDKAVNEVGKI